uniref:hemopexin repeat-containing protein n=1 Tax=Candidatus Entotheonella palauensis TaxID=93172 RepID=UPI0021193F26
FPIIERFPVGRKNYRMLPERIDAAIAWEDGKVYFFREDEYIRYDMTLYRADPGYPKPLIGEYAEDWSFFSDYQQ